MARVFCIVQKRVVARIVLEDSAEEFDALGRWLDFTQGDNPPVGAMQGGLTLVEEDEPGHPPCDKALAEQPKGEFLLTDKLTDVPYSEWVRAFPGKAV